jgi:ribonuclease VapC
MVIDTSAVLANFGDCAVYALARTLGEPLLFVGNDFAQTDIDRC